MNIDRAVFLFAGGVVLAGCLLSLFVHPWFIGLPVFAGLNMIQAAFTGLCPVAVLFRKMGVKPGAAFF